MGKQVKTPRFYVDMVIFLHATGQLGWDDDKGGAELLYMNCSNPYLVPMEPNGDDASFKIGRSYENIAKTSFPINFCALLNHNLNSVSNNTYCKVSGVYNQSTFTYLSSEENYNNILNTNANGDSDDLGATYNGTSIFTFSDKNGLEKDWVEFAVVYDNGNTDIDFAQLGSMVVGRYWDAPNSPDMNLTMERRFDGIKRQKTIGGKTLANIYYDGPTEWTMNSIRGTYKYPPFELDFPLSTSDDDEFNRSAKSGLGRKGLRSWKLTFSYISEDNMWTDYESSSTAPFIDDGYNSEIDGDAPIDPTQRPNPMLSDDSFNFVWNCTLGGTLPFIFQPDNTNNNPDQFSICTFRGNSLSVKQVAFNTYTLSVTIDEVA